MPPSFVKNHSGPKQSMNCWVRLFESPESQSSGESDRSRRVPLDSLVQLPFFDMPLPKPWTRYSLLKVIAASTAQGGSLATPSQRLALAVLFVHLSAHPN